MTNKQNYCGKNEWGSDVKFSSHTSNSRGVAILFKNSFQYIIHNEIKDPGGNYIILDISIQNTRLSLVALYVSSKLKR